MADLLPLIPPPKGNLPTTPQPKSDPLETVIYSVGTAAVILSQLTSKSYPHLADVVTENALGPKINAAKRSISLKPPIAGLFLAPPPVGFISPRRFGLEPNYVFEFESRLKSNSVLGGRGLEKLLPPPSHFFHNLPDNDPRVLEEKLEYQAREQQLIIRDLAKREPLDDVFALLDVARGPTAGQFFVSPQEAREEIEAQLIQRLHGVNEFRQELQRRDILKAELNLPAPNTQPNSIPSPFDTPPKFENFQPPSFQTTADLFAQLTETGARRPLEDPPVSTLQQIAAKIAPEVVKHLATERADP